MKVDRIKHDMIKLLKFLHDRIMEKDILIENLDKEKFNFSNCIWEKHFNLKYRSINEFRINKESSDEVFKDVGQDLKEFMEKQPNTYGSLENNIFNYSTPISKALKRAILYGYIKAEFKDNSQTIYITQDGLKKIDIIQDGLEIIDITQNVLKKINGLK